MLHEGKKWRGALAIPVSWGLDSGEVNCMGHLEVVAQSFVEHELSALKHHGEYIYGGVKEGASQSFCFLHLYLKHMELICFG